MSMTTQASMMKEQNTMDANLGDRLIGWVALVGLGFIIGLTVGGIQWLVE